MIKKTESVLTTITPIIVSVFVVYLTITYRYDDAISKKLDRDEFVRHIDSWEQTKKEDRQRFEKITEALYRLELKFGTLPKEERK